MRVALMLAFAIPFNAAAAAENACLQALNGAITANEEAMEISRATRAFQNSLYAQGAFCTQAALDKLGEEIAGYQAAVEAAAAVEGHCQGEFAELGRETKELAQRNLAARQGAEARFRQDCGR